MEAADNPPESSGDDPSVPAADNDVAASTERTTGTVDGECLVVERAWVPQEFNDMLLDFVVHPSLGSSVPEDDLDGESLSENCVPAPNCGHAVELGATLLEFDSASQQWMLNDV